MVEWINTLNLDVHTTILVVILGLIVIGAGMIFYGIRILRYGTEISYVHKRQQITKQGLRIIACAIAIGMMSLICGRFGEALIYQVYEPSSTITITPSITPSLTSTLTPTITLTPTLTRTPSITPIPSLPGEIIAEFSSDLEPDENIIFSQLKFSDAVDEYYQPIVEQVTFEVPVEKVYASFTYNNMLPGLQWSAVWLNPDGELICYETESWGNYTGGYGYSECEYDSLTWIEGEYQVQIFLGMDWWQTDSFWFGIQPEAIQTVEP